ncbi:MAG: GNAT family N-acetyltransferase [Bacteroidota bacterium]|nr:GNAT family N-acetyltransferase [Bacteroidota bacterium]
MIQIIPYYTKHQYSIDEMMQGIASEFEESISLPPEQVPAILKILPNPYWIAVLGDKMVGTAGLAGMKNNFAALRRMFVDKSFCGMGLSETLLNMTLEAAKTYGADMIYLGTMAQFRAAQKFYEKHGFIQICKEDLPNYFPLNPIDKVFYKLSLN